MTLVAIVAEAALAEAPLAATITITEAAIAEAAIAEAALAEASLAEAPRAAATVTSSCEAISSLATGWCYLGRKIEEITTWRSPGHPAAVRKVAGRMRQHRNGKMKRECMRYAICVFGYTLGFLTWTLTHILYDGFGKGVSFEKMMTCLLGKY